LKAAAAAFTASGGILGAFDGYHVTREDDGIHGAMGATATPASAGLRQIDEEDEDEHAIEMTLAPVLQPPSRVDKQNV
jgi:hypothetical protein